jgi:Na+-transporting methylmalonyl-CoA/oxaloacetate decarboxylase gamma subunit
MKKESITAVVLGIGLGLVVAIFLIGFIRQSSKVGADVAVPTIDPKPKTTDVIGKSLEVSSPQDKEVFSTRRITVKGKAGKGSLIMIQSPLTEVVQKLNKDDYSIPFDLAIGENVIVITVYPSDKTQREQQKTVKVYYIDEE